jgi:murein L,D-transpeptidase YcbB/YkuD
MSWQHGFADNHITQPRHLPSQSLPVFNHWLEFFPLDQYHLSQRLTQKTLRISGLRLNTLKLLKKLYKQREYRYIWTKDNRLNDNGQLLYLTLRDAGHEGLRAEEYNTEALTLCLQAAIRKNCDITDIELLLSDALLRYSTHVRRGRLNPKNIENEWHLEREEKWQPIVLLENALTNEKFAQYLRDLPPPHPQYKRLKSLLAKSIQQADKTLWPVLIDNKKLKLKDQGHNVSVVRDRLRASGALAMTACDNPNLFDTPLKQAVLTFQRQHGLDRDGVVGPLTRRIMNRQQDTLIEQIKVNMERWRWVTRDFGTDYLLVNTAGFQLDIYQAKKHVHNMRVIVGRPDRSTPVFKGDMRYLVVNPSWNVPFSIAIKDMLPKARQNPDYLVKKGIEVFYAGRKVSPWQVNWWNVSARHFPLRLRQPPSDKNALGRIKFMFPNRFNVYLHDTSSRNLFSKTERALSSGCIRVERPMRLAQYVLKTQWDAKKFKKILKSKRSKTLNLPKTLPVYLLYWTVWIDGKGIVQFREDIYGRDRKIRKALARLH